MSTDLDQILSGVTPGIAEECQQHLVDHFAPGIHDPPKGNFPLFHCRGLSRTSEDGVGHTQRLRPADPDHGERPLTRRRGECCNGFPVCHGQHASTRWPGLV